MILADENVDKLIIDSIKVAGFQVSSIKEDKPGISDEAIIHLSKETPQIILTNDKDFGEWVFSHQVQDISVIFLRYKYPERKRMAGIVSRLIKNHHQDLWGKFTTVTINKIRSTRLW